MMNQSLEEPYLKNFHRLKMPSMYVYIDLNIS